MELGKVLTTKVILLLLLMRADDSHKLWLAIIKSKNSTFARSVFEPRLMQVYVAPRVNSPERQQFFKVSTVSKQFLSLC